MKQMTAVRMALCSLFTALIAIGAFLQIPLPNFDYFTLQFFFVLMAGMLLGARLGALSAALYVLIGLLGIPVFAAGGGISYVLRPSFGFLLGFIVTAFCSGWIMQHGQRKWKTCFLAVLAGLLATYGIGLAYKYVILNYYTGTEISFSVQYPCGICSFAFPCGRMPWYKTGEGLCQADTEIRCCSRNAYQQLFASEK